jgi:AmmeMemoRadiSam system protein A
MPVSPCIELSPADQQTLISMVRQVLQRAAQDRVFRLPSPPTSVDLLQVTASFVTLYVNNALRGCIGSCTASDPLWKDVCCHAYASACEDARFPVLELAELDALSFDIAMLSELEAIKNRGEAALLTQLVPAVDGLLLQDGHHRAIFLPSVWRTLPDPRAFIRALKQKGGWPADYWDAGIQIHTFQTSVING